MTKLIEQSDIIASLQPMLQYAREKKLMLLLTYTGEVFTPDEVDALHAAGRYIWGARNWKHFDPLAHLGALGNKLAAAQRDYDNFAKRLDDYMKQPSNKDTTTP